MAVVFVVVNSNDSGTVEVHPGSPRGGFTSFYVFTPRCGAPHVILCARAVHLL